MPADLVSKEESARSRALLLVYSLARGQASDLPELAVVSRQDKGCFDPPDRDGVLINVYFNAF